MVEVTDTVTPSFEKEGWERRSILDEPRLSEVVEMYEQMGLEVKVVELEVDNTDECQTCLEPGTHKVVYTRKKKE